MEIKTLKDARAWVADWKGRPNVALLDSAIQGRTFILNLARERGDKKKAAREAKVLDYFQRLKRRLYEPGAKKQRRAPAGFRFSWIHPEPKVWKLYLHHFTAEVRPAPYNYDGPQTWMADMWIGSSTGGTNSNRIDMQSKTSAEARRKVEAEYRKLVRMKSWLVDVPVGPHQLEGGKRRHSKEPAWYQLLGKWVLELGKKGFAHVSLDERWGYDTWRVRTYDPEGNLIHEGSPRGLKHAKEWARMMMDVPAGRGLDIDTFNRHEKRWRTGGKRRHGAPGITKLDAEVRGMLKR